jgi:hypothetical protein
VATDWRQARGGTRLTQDSYVREVDERLWSADGADSWKLERRQEYLEAGFPSWEAFAAGDWERSMALYDELRPGLIELGRISAEHKTVFRRVRVVERPVSVYLRWELAVLRVRAQCWESIRVVDAAALRSVEAGGPLVDALSLCGQTFYHTLYTSDGRPDGAVRFTDPAVIHDYEVMVRALYDAGQDLDRFQLDQ